MSGLEMRDYDDKYTLSPSYTTLVIHRKVTKQAKVNTAESSI